MLWIGAALVLRFIAMGIAIHPDMQFINYFSSKLPYEGVFDIYRYIDINCGPLGPDRSRTYYPPLTYFTLGIFQLILNFHC